MQPADKDMHFHVQRCNILNPSATTENHFLSKNSGITSLHSKKKNLRRSRKIMYIHFVHNAVCCK